MMHWLAADFGLCAVDASHILRQRVRLDVANVFNPAYSIACAVPREAISGVSGRTRGKAWSRVKNLCSQEPPKRRLSAQFRDAIRHVQTMASQTPTAMNTNPSVRNKLIG
jgi:hypothetical protein